MTGQEIRPALAGRVGYRQSFRKCGKHNCATCRHGAGHGPYWYATWREGNRVRSRYLGRDLPNEELPKRASVRTLGKLEVVLPGGGKVTWARRPRDLFTMLLSAPTGSIGREEVAEAFWPDFDPIAAHQNVRVTVSALRKLLRHPHWVVIEGPVVTLALPAETRDDVAFEQAGLRALESDDIDSMRQAIESYQGVYLVGDMYNDWTTYRRQQVAELRRRLVLRAALLFANAGQPQEALPWLRSLTADDPCDEPVCRLLIRLYLSSGRRTEALRAYETLRKALRAELEVEPEEETLTLFEQARAERD